MSSEKLDKTISERRANRQTFDGFVQFRRGPRRANVKILDISALGARISGVYLVHRDDEIYLKLPMIESIPARVAWVEEFEFGCEFARPLSEVVLDAMIRAQP